MNMWLVFILPPTPRLVRSVTKNITVRTVSRDMRPMFHDQLVVSGEPVLENIKFEYGVHTAAQPQTCEKC